MSNTYSAGLMWFRRDLRSHDNAALYHALKTCRQVHCVFTFDTEILDSLPRRDRRVEFIRESLVDLDEALRSLAGHADAGLIVRHAKARDEIPRLARELGVQSVFMNHDYEPQALARDAAVRGALADAGIALHSAKDQVIFEGNELLTQVGRPYAVFTPYKKAWLAKVDAFYFKPYPVAAYAAALAPRPSASRQPVLPLAEIGFEATNLAELPIPTGVSGGRALFDDFAERIGLADVEQGELGAAVEEVNVHAQRLAGREVQFDDVRRQILPRVHARSADGCRSPHFT